MLSEASKKIVKFCSLEGSLSTPNTSNQPDHTNDAEVARHHYHGNHQKITEEDEMTDTASESEHPAARKSSNLRLTPKPGSQTNHHKFVQQQFMYFYV